ncbi:alpha/beta hydrolase [Sphingobacterium rhinopitheci]|uniref:alpha/beta hydrolase n=1 Tax=Sphingobacterium rhinopitheci TaxID=2781960 RepID=UPI001F5227A7|nr:alpha/beta hydrolase [Sphingobacterium rhinopitheci]
MLKSLNVILFLFMILPTQAQESVQLYPNGVPNIIPNVSLGANAPEFYFYKPEKQINSKVFLIIPGGGYGMVAINHEGHDLAKRLKDLGYASFVLKYRLPVDSQMLDKRIAPIQDAQNAIVYIRQNANRLGVDLKDVVVMGFSAGGHLASTLSTHFDTSYIGSVDTKLLRPDYSVLVYPVITMKEGITHAGSKKNLIGPNFEDEDVKRFSNELNINSNTPPAFIIHAEDDKVVPIQNALFYKEGLDNHAVKNKFYYFQKGGHGFGMYNKLEEGDWFADMIVWLNNN